MLEDCLTELLLRDPKLLVTPRPQRCLCWDPLGSYENGQEGKDGVDRSDVRASGEEGVQEAVRQQGLTCHRVGRYGLAGRRRLCEGSVWATACWDGDCVRCSDATCAITCCV